MEFWIKAAQLITSLSILVFLHELGHFIPARIFKTRVEKFYLFFNPWFSIFKKKIGETEWGIGWLPLGGYVKISGMIDESMDTEQMKQPEQPWEFRSKPAWQRLIIMIGGVTVNLILGYVIYSMVLFTWGRDVIKPTDIKHGYSVGKMAEDIGFKDGDIVLSYDGKELEDGSQGSIIQAIMVRNPKSFEVLHADGKKEDIKIPEGFGMKMFKAKKETELFQPRVSPIIGSVTDTLPAGKAGVKAGDSIIGINGTPVAFFNDFLSVVRDTLVDSVHLDIVRNGKQLAFDMKKQEGLVGIGGQDLDQMSSLKITHIDYSFGEAITSGFSFAYWSLHDYVTQFKYIFTKRGSTSVGGFAAIGNMFAPQWDWHSFWSRTALISIILAFMNILPIPALDGGHVMFLLYEIITGRQPPQKFLEYAQMVGFILLIGLLLYANGLDLVKWIFGK